MTHWAAEWHEGKVEEPKKCSSAHFPVVKPALSGIELDFFGPSTLTTLSFLNP